MQALLYGIAERGLWAVFAVATLSFLLYYLIFAALGWWLSKSVFPRWRIGDVVDKTPLRKGQVEKEIRRSALSIAIFGAYGVVNVEMYRWRWVDVEWNASVMRIAWDFVLLFLFNEVHFFCCHRLLHTPWLFKHVHRVHHESVPTTPFSTFSFHWVESLLLGSVMSSAMLVHTFSIWALLGLPSFSLFFNTIGHWNYNVFAPTGLRSVSVEHSHHHMRVKGNFGFFLPVLDRVFHTYL